RSPHLVLHVATGAGDAAWLAQPAHPTGRGLHADVPAGRLRRSVRFLRDGPHPRARRARPGLPGAAADHPGRDVYAPYLGSVHTETPASAYVGAGGFAVALR